jgi:hypothetical protein
MTERPSPSEHAKNFADKIKKGNDGNKYISKKDKNGVYRWIKIADKNIKSYFIHDNGERPFKVDVSDNIVEIYKRRSVENNIDYSERIKKFTVKEVYIGQSPYGKGNSILLNVSRNKYIYIGHKIYEFTIEDKFEAYYSVIGNNDVPYPVLLGSKYVYFMLDYVYISRDLFKAKMNASEWADAYSYYYGFKDYNNGELIKKERNKNINRENEKKMKNLRLLGHL